MLRSYLSFGFVRFRHEDKDHSLDVLDSNRTYNYPCALSVYCNRPIPTKCSTLQFAVTTGKDPRCGGRSMTESTKFAVSRRCRDAPVAQGLESRV
ncbi:DUF1684 domain-containing protein [Bifidobacterium sp. ESL0704]|uniref:DUF1684 domain-containing protein n=1 Tax=Bifidobacterium sp. ESL0704 TaxID=2983219 RepID=UPI0032AEC32C